MGLCFLKGQKGPIGVFDRVERDVKSFRATGKMSQGGLKIVSFLS